MNYGLGPSARMARRHLPPSLSSAICDSRFPSVKSAISAWPCKEWPVSVTTWRSSVKAQSLTHRSVPTPEPSPGVLQEVAQQKAVE